MDKEFEGGWRGVGRSWPGRRPLSGGAGPAAAAEAGAFGRHDVPPSTCSDPLPAARATLRPVCPPAGQEECLICYSIIQPTSGQLPRLSCRTCRKRCAGLAPRAGGPARTSGAAAAATAAASAACRRLPAALAHSLQPCLPCPTRLSPSPLAPCPPLHPRSFHGGCLYKWFKSSGKSNCPHCQSPVRPGVGAVLAKGWEALWAACGKALLLACRARPTFAPSFRHLHAVVSESSSSEFCWQPHWLRLLSLQCTCDCNAHVIDT